MNYNRIYSELISRAKNRTILQGNYKEIHHIVPRSLGGTDDSGNLVALFPEEHYLAHKLLYKIHKNRETAFAFKMMSHMNNKKYKVTKELALHTKTVHTEETKKLMSKLAKEGFETGTRRRLIGSENPMFGKKPSPETRMKIREKISGRNNGNYGKKWTQEQRDKASGENNPSYGSGGKFCIFSKDYENRQGLTKDELEIRRKEVAKKISETIKNNGTSDGHNNPNAKKINIYNNAGELVFECYGNLRQTCNENNLPFNALFKSQKSNGSRIYQNLGSNETRLEKSGFLKYVGWYAMNIG